MLRAQDVRFIYPGAVSAPAWYIVYNNLIYPGIRCGMPRIAG